MKPTLWTLPLLAVSALPAGARAAEPTANGGSPVLAVFRDDARLNAKIEVAEKDKPLGELLDGIEKPLGLHLSASRDTADDKVTLFAKGRPASEMLTAIARQFDFQWKKTANGYEAFQDLNTRQKEAALRDGMAAEQLRRIQARMDLLDRLSGLRQEQIGAREAELRDLLRSPDLAPAERAALTGESEAIQDLQRPGALAALKIYRTLNAAQFRQLVAGGELRLSTKDGTLARGLLDEIDRATQQQRSSSTQVFARAEVRRNADAPEKPDEPEGPPTRADATIRLTDGSGMFPGPRRGQQGLPERQMRLEFVMNTGHDGPVQRIIPVFWSPTLSNASDSEKIATVTDDPDLKREVQLAFTPPPARPATAPVFSVLPANAVPLGELSAKLSEASGLNILADSYIRVRIDPALVSGKRPVVQILDAVANQLRYTWVKEGDLIRFRSRVYYFDRAEEVPDRTLRPWERRVAKAGAPSLDDLSELAASLSDYQTRSMQDFWAWYLQASDIEAPTGPGGFHDSRHHLRFWASLTRGQRNTALAKEVIPVAKMNRIQRDAFVLALNSRATGMLFGPLGGDGGQGMPTATDIATGGFSLDNNTVQQQQFRGTGANGEQVGIISITGQSVTGNGPRQGGNPPPMPAPMPRILGPDGETSITAAGPPKTLDNIMFRYHLAGNPQPVKTAAIMLAHPKPK